VLHGSNGHSGVGESLQLDHRKELLLQRRIHFHKSGESIVSGQGDSPKQVPESIAVPEANQQNTG
jgi:hypothetical protein